MYIVHVYIKYVYIMYILERLLEKELETPRYQTPPALDEAELGPRPNPQREDLDSSRFDPLRPKQSLIFRDELLDKVKSPIFSTWDFLSLSLSCEASCCADWPYSHRACRDAEGLQTGQSASGSQRKRTHHLTNRLHAFMLSRSWRGAQPE